MSWSFIGRREGTWTAFENMEHTPPTRGCRYESSLPRRPWPWAMSLELCHARRCSLTRLRALASWLLRSPTSMATIKAQLYRDVDLELDQALEEANVFMQESLKQPDFQEGIASFIEGRAPQFAPVRSRPFPAMVLPGE
jgi:hypothetical protein